MDGFRYSNAEMHDMIMIYGEAHGNAAAAQRIYRERFPDRNTPNPRTFTAISQRLRETGSFTRKNEGGRPRDGQNEEQRILDYFEEQPTSSCRGAASALQLPSHMAAFRTLHRHDLHPFRYQKVQALKPADHAPRVQFCEWLLQRLHQDRNMFSKIIFTDEATFSREGIFNSHNLHEWSHENHHNIREHGHQERFTVNVWAGIAGDYLIGPYILPERLTGEVYAIFLDQVLPGLLQNIPNRILEETFYQHDGAPPHFSMAARDILNARFPNRWIGRAGPISWPPRSPDLTPLDFFLWGYLKSLVYETPVQSDQDLIARIVAAAGEISDNPAILRRVRHSLENRCGLCIQERGRNFEHLL